MVILLQLAILVLVCVYRLWHMHGGRLKTSPHGTSPDQLERVWEHKGHLKGCYFGLSQQHGFPFIVRRERWYHRLLKSIGIASEISLRDEIIDRNWYFITDYPEHLERALHNEHFLKALRVLLQRPVLELWSTPHRLWCKIDVKQVDKDLLTRKLFWQRLADVRDHVQQPVHQGQLRFPRQWRAFAFIALHAGLFFTACFGFLPTLLDENEIVSNREWLMHAVAYAVTAAFLWFMVIMAFFRQTSWAGWVVADFVLVGLVGVLVTSGYLVREVNIHMDMAKPVHIERRVTNRYCEIECEYVCGRRCSRTETYRIEDRFCTPETRQDTLNTYSVQYTTCQSNADFKFTLEMPHWHEGKETYSYAPMPHVFDRVQTGTLVSVPVHEGALGIEWVNTREIQPATPAR